MLDDRAVYAPEWIVTERQQLLQMLATLPPDEDVVLATVVKVEGSAYRRPGARMLIPRYGSAVGTLSGGCLESEVSKKAWWLTEGGKAVVCRYSTASLAVDGEPVDEDAELTFGLGCNGTVHVLLQRLPGSAPLFGLLRAVEHGRTPAAQALVIEKSGECALNIGDSLQIDTDNKQTGKFAEPQLDVAVMAELAAVRTTGQTRLLRFQRGDTQLELLLECLSPAPELIVVGAGHDAEPLVHLAASMGWRVTVIDGRRHFARAERFPHAVQVLCLSPADPDARALPAAAAAVIMTHSFSQDRDWLAHFLAKSPRYLGQLGPKSRTERLLNELGHRTESERLAAMAGIHAPVGLDLGGSTPEAVALAILAEAQAALNGRCGGQLKDRSASIHLAEPVSIRPWPTT